MVFSQSRPQAHHHLLGQVAEIEAALIGVIAVGGHLLERLDEFGRAIESVIRFPIGDRGVSRRGLRADAAIR